MPDKISDSKIRLTDRVSKLRDHSRPDGWFYFIEDPGVMWRYIPSNVTPEDLRAVADDMEKNSEGQNQ